MNGLNVFLIVHVMYQVYSAKDKGGGGVQKESGGKRMRVYHNRILPELAVPFNVWN